MIFILDRSGLEKDTIGGYNSLLAKQRKETGEAVITTVLFDDKYKMLHDRVAIGEIKDITDKEYFARGMTGLLDAVGKTINHVGNRHKNAIDSEVPDKTIVAIITDGQENASREYSLAQVKHMIERQKEKYGREFLFLGANIDAVSVAADIGISADRAVKYEADGMGTIENFAAVSNVQSAIRNRIPITENQKADIEKHRERKEKNR